MPASNGKGMRIPLNLEGLAGEAELPIETAYRALHLLIDRKLVKLIDGCIHAFDLEALSAMLVAGPRPALVSVMLANNETGVIQPLGEVAALVRASDALPAGRYRLVVEGALGNEPFRREQHFTVAAVEPATETAAELAADATERRD